MTMTIAPSHFDMDYPIDIHVERTEDTENCAIYDKRSYTIYIYETALALSLVHGVFRCADGFRCLCIYGIYIYMFSN